MGIPRPGSVPIRSRLRGPEDQLGEVAPRDSAVWSMGPISVRRLGVALSIGASREGKGHGQGDVSGVIESFWYCLWRWPSGIRICMTY